MRKDSFEEEGDDSKKKKKLEELAKLDESDEEAEIPEVFVYPCFLKPGK